MVSKRENKDKGGPNRQDKNIGLRKESTTIIKKESIDHQIPTPYFNQSYLSTAPKEDVTKSGEKGCLEKTT